MVQNVITLKAIIHWSSGWRMTLKWRRLSVAGGCPCFKFWQLIVEWNTGMISFVRVHVCVVINTQVFGGFFKPSFNKKQPVPKTSVIESSVRKTHKRQSSASNPTGSRSISPNVCVSRFIKKQAKSLQLVWFSLKKQWYDSLQACSDVAHRKWCFQACCYWNWTKLATYIQDIVHLFSCEFNSYCSSRVMSPLVLLSPINVTPQIW